MYPTLGNTQRAAVPRGGRAEVSHGDADQREVPPFRRASDVSEMHAIGHIAAPDRRRLFLPTLLHVV